MFDQAHRILLGTNNSTKSRKENFAQWGVAACSFTSPFENVGRAVDAFERSRILSLFGFNCSPWLVMPSAGSHMS